MSLLGKSCKLYMFRQLLHHSDWIVPDFLALLFKRFLSIRYLNEKIDVAYIILTFDCHYFRLMSAASLCGSF